MPPKNSLAKAVGRPEDILQDDEEDGVDADDANSTPPCDQMHPSRLSGPALSVMQRLVNDAKAVARLRGEAVVVARKKKTNDATSPSKFSIRQDHASPSKSLPKISLHRRAKSVDVISSTIREAQQQQQQQMQQQMQRSLDDTEAPVPRRKRDSFNLGMKKGSFGRRKSKLKHQLQQQQQQQPDDPHRGRQKPSSVVAGIEANHTPISHHPYYQHHQRSQSCVIS